MLILVGAILPFAAVRLPALLSSVSADPLSRAAKGPGLDAEQSQGRLYLLGRRIDLNLATPRELDLLPGIGPKRAQAILRLRSEKGRLCSLEDLKTLPGWGPHLAQTLRPLVCFSPERPS